MDANLLKIMGQIAGIGGLALGVILIVFREVIRKNIFPTLASREAYRLLRLIIVLVWIVAVVGIGAWVFISVRAPTSLSENRSSITSVQPAETSDLNVPLSSSPSKEPTNESAAESNHPVEVTIFIRADATSVISLDGNEIANIRRGQTVTKATSAGEHLITASVAQSSLRWDKSVTVDSGQVTVETELVPILLKAIQGKWEWFDRQVVDGKCVRRIESGWNLTVADVTAPDNIQIKLERKAARYLWDPFRITDCESLPDDYSCKQIYRLTLRSLDDWPNLQFEDDTRPGTVGTAQLGNNYYATQFCSTWIPPIGFVGKLTALSPAKLRLTVSNPNIDVLLTKH